MTIFRFKVIDYTSSGVSANDNAIETDNPDVSDFSVMKHISDYRKEIDAIDHQLSDLLGKRFRIAEKVAEYKKANGVPVRIQSRIDEVLKNAETNGKANGLPPRLGYFLWQEIIAATCFMEEDRISGAIAEYSEIPEDEEEEIIGK
jgi:chorismate mutase